MNREWGFTLIELIIVIVVIGILISVTGYVQASALVGARDAERADDTASIARLLEQSYNNLSSASPTYPPTTTLLSDISGSTGSATSADPSMFRAPNAPGSSVIPATITTAPSVGSTGISLNQYMYQPITATDTLCSSTSSICVKFRLYYVKESNNRLMTLNSAHQQ